MLSKNPKIGFIGFGEVAYYFSKGLKEDGIERILAYDKNSGDPECGGIVRERAIDSEVPLVSALQELVVDSEVIISAVWGNQALHVAEEAACFIRPRAIYADVNNTAPSAKKLGAQAINAKGAKYVDMALFVAPEKDKHRSFVCVSGDGSKEFMKLMREFGMKIELVPGEAGQATTIKTLANIYYKGIQALCLELALSAWKAGIDLEVLAPLVVKPVENLPKAKELAFWMVRGAIHAERKAAEMESMIEAIRDWGLEPIMLEATRKRFHKISQLGLRSHFNADLSIDDYKVLIEAFAKLSKEKGIALT